MFLSYIRATSFKAFQELDTDIKVASIANHF